MPGGGGVPRGGLPPPSPKASDLRPFFGTFRNSQRQSQESKFQKFRFSNVHFLFHDKIFFSNFQKNTKIGKSQKKEDQK